MLDPSRIATVAQAIRQPIRKTKSMLDTAQLQNALVRRQHPAVKSDTHLVARSLETLTVEAHLHSWRVWRSLIARLTLPRQQNHSINPGFPLDPSVNILQ